MSKKVLITGATGGSYNQQDILSWEFITPYNPILTPGKITLAITSPATNQFFAVSPTNLLLTATATDSAGTITNLQFFDDFSFNPYVPVLATSSGQRHFKEVSEDSDDEELFVKSKSSLDRSCDIKLWRFT